jgi:hypothetical protein
MRALAVEAEVVRLRHPVDNERFRPRAPLHASPRRILLLSNYLSGDRRALFEAAASEAGMEVSLMGQDGETALDPSTAINKADIVVAKGRSVLEGMACGRPTYIYDIAGCDGWVSAERYPLLEADGFAGRAEPITCDALRIQRDLAAYRPEMGQASRDLVMANHLASRHAQELVGLFRSRSSMRPRPRDPLREIERLARVQARAELQARGLSRELEAVRRDVRQARMEADQARAEADGLRRTRRYRIGSALASPGDRLRVFRGRRRAQRIAR